jgi:DNA (cytosine-5)-methyltransferase 1
MNEAPNFVDIFSAPGGLSLGFQMAGFRPLVAVDIDKHGVETLSYNFPKTKVLLKDIRDLDGRELLDEIGHSGGIDVIGGGPPCQGYSNVGRVKIASLVREGIWKLQNGNPRMIDDPRNLLYKEFVRLVRDCHPKFFIMENVNGITSYKDGELLAEIKENFQLLGYNVDYKLFDAVNFGVPQHRKRVFFMGNRLGVPNPFPNSHSVEGNSATDDAVTVWQAIGDLPTLKAGRGSEVMEYNKSAFHIYQEWARKGASNVFNHVARPHAERDIRTFESMRPGSKWKDLRQEFRDLYGYREDIFNDKFKRLWKKRPSWTITAHLCKDGYVYIHPTQSRTITVREAARLQSFPDRFAFRGPRSSQFRQVGNAVPPLMAKRMALGIRKVLRRVSLVATAK